ncbi:MAG: hypothetical protein HY043_22485 [Verrucomicrobia bacterium]|nr:hypothetical protein [Verrucomicrobiota bacterium]
MNANSPQIFRAATLLAINLLYLMIWGFAGISKVIDGMPPWFGDKFGATILGKVLGLSATFWILTASELLAFALALAALVRLEFARCRPPPVLAATLVWSLFVFLQLGFGQWLTGEFNGAFQQFMYGSGTLVALLVVCPEVAKVG